MIMGTNNIMGGSHRTKARDRHIKEINNNRKAVAEICESYLSYGVDTIIGCLVKSDFAMNGIRDAEQNTGKKITVIELGVFDTADTHQARTEADLFTRSCAEAAK